ncbi:MAG: alanine dehydrogenase, partial [Candidatus Omnitrophica bacterium]|nr:alanine dehydrogenase [Candidatus Omnitrophota bacterium]
MVPAGVEILKKYGHTVMIENGAGLGSGITDEEYEEAGGKLVKSPAEIFRRANLLVKVKEPLPKEYDLLSEGQIVFTYFHFAADFGLTKAMLKKKITAIAYETIQKDDGKLPLLTPMSEVAGRMSIQEGAKCLEKPIRGRGILLSGVPGVSPAFVVILGGGVVGANAAKVAAGLGAVVTILDIDADRMRYLDDIMPEHVTTLMSNSYNIREKLRDADLLIGAVLIPGGRTPLLITKEMLKLMKPGSVFVDVAIDQGGCSETSRPTTHSNPTYIVDDVVHYCVTNIPGAVGRTSTYALTNVTLPYVVELANKGFKKAVEENSPLRRGLNMMNGRIYYQKVADVFDMECYSLNN